ncbi:MAG: serine hydrolase [Candidatus Sumerlaeota bacterium]|nr:serine hydrolase [Candidatus Sumerlaeota bacterium]
MNIISRSILILIFIFILGSVMMGVETSGLKGGLPKAPVLKWTNDAHELGLDPAIIKKAFEALDAGAKENKVPGSVAVIGRNGYALYPYAAGHSILQPEKLPMTPDTVFDLASVTKMVATNTSVMILIEEGKIRLDDPVARYLPEFGANGKETVTVRQLLTHTSGFPPFKLFYKTLKGREEFYRAVCNEGLTAAPGTRRTYSDLGFMTLGFIVEKVSGKDLNTFTQERIFRPLGMKNTRFQPPTSWKRRTAATEVWPFWKRLAWGEVHDENANAMGGVAGHAGLFSTAHDLAIFCQMLLNGGKYGDAQILHPETVRQFYTPQTPPAISAEQGMGWILSGKEKDESGGIRPEAFSHSGFTGTSLWVSPKHNTFAILLMNAIHPDREKAERAFVRTPFQAAVLKVIESAKSPAHSLNRLFPADQYWVEKTLRQMTLEEKAGQLIFPSYQNKEEVALRLLETVKPGGFIAYHGGTALHLAELINRLQEESELPLLMTADFERGVGCYIDGATDLPGNMGLGASGRLSDVKEAARITAIESRAIGVHLDFAPVLDVNNNPKNPIINIRSFGEDPQMVARLGVTLIKSAQKHGLLATGKHFPGHGNTYIDSHSSMGKIEGSVKELHKVELLPFEKAIKDAQVSSIMTAHLWIPAYEPTPLAATLSKKIMNRLLRNEFGFKGILFTDAMNMKGVARGVTFEESIIRAIEAGCDAILMPGDPEKAHKVIVEAVNNGRLKAERIDASVRRILAAKTRVNLHRERFTDMEKLETRVGTKEFYELAKKMAYNSLTLVRHAPETLPLSTRKTTAVIMIANEVGNVMVWRDIYTFGNEVKKLNPQTQVLFMGDNVTTDGKEQATRLIHECDQVIIALYPRIVVGRGNVSLNVDQRQLLDELIAIRLPYVVISFGSPYVVTELPEAPTYICAYGNAAAVQAAAAEALFTKGRFHGQLPVTIQE